MAYDRSPSKNIYLNVAVNTLKKLRGLVPSTVPGLSSKLGRAGAAWVLHLEDSGPVPPVEDGWDPPCGLSAALEW